MAAPGKLDRLLVAIEGEERCLKIPPVVLARGGEALGLKPCSRAHRKRQCGSPAGKTDEKRAAVKRHG
jgi:hypothetical protein